MTKLEAPERVFGSRHSGQVWRFADCVETGCYESQEYIRADLHQQALEAAREEGRRQGLEEAGKYHINFLMTQTNASVEKIVASTEAIRALAQKEGE